MPVNVLRFSTWQDILKKHVRNKIELSSDFLGVEHLSTYMKIYKVGDIVDVKVSWFFTQEILDRDLSLNFMKFV